MEKVTFCKTKAGKGYKLCIDGTWLYTSAEALNKVLYDLAKSCQFTAYQEEGE